MNTDKPTFRFSDWPVVVTLAVLLFIGLKLPSLPPPHDEGDELIYVALARNLIAHGQYNLIGQPVYETLSPAMYHHPLFNHPPLLPALIIPFVQFGEENKAVMLSWFGHFLCILGVGIQCRLLVSEDSRGNSDRDHQWMLWLPVLAVCMDPTLFIISRKIWMDDLMAGFVTLTAAFGFLAQRRRVGYSIAAGAALGAAGLLKMVALAFAPFLVWILYQPDEKTPMRKWRFAAVAISTCILFVLPWEIVFWNTFHALLPYWHLPDATLIEKNAFIRMTVSQPWYYYLVTLPVACPAVLLGGWGLLQSVVRENQIVRINAAFCLGYVLLLTTTSVSGLGFQMRYLAPAISSTYVLFGACLLATHRWRNRAVVVGLLCLIWCSLSIVPYVIRQRIDEFFPLWSFVSR